MKKTVFSLFLVLLMLFAVACGTTSPADTPSGNGTVATDTPPPTKSSDTPQEDIIIKMFSNVPDRTSGLGLLEQTDIDLYVQQNQNVKIELELLQDEPYKMKLQTYMQSGDMPDIWMQWGSRAMLKPTVDGGFAEELNVADYADYNFVPGALASFSSDGKLYGLPKNADFWILFYNKAILDQYNIPVPQTTDDLIAAAKILKDAGLSCVASAGKDGWPTVANLNCLMVRKTGDPTVIKNAILNGNATGNQDMIDGLNEFKRLVEAGVFQPSMNSDDYGTAKNLFIQGQAAFFAMGSWEMGMGSDETIDTDIRTNIRAVKFPTVTGWNNGNPDDLTMWYGGGYSVSSKSSVKEEALSLLNFLISPNVYAKNAWEGQIVIPPMKYDQYFTGSENDLQKDLTDILNTARSTTGDLYNDCHTTSFKTDCEIATIEFAEGMITAEQYLERLDVLAAEANQG